MGHVPEVKCIAVGSIPGKGLYRCVLIPEDCLLSGMESQTIENAICQYFNSVSTLKLIHTEKMLILWLTSTVVMGSFR